MQNHPTDFFTPQIGDSFSKTSINKYVYFKQNFLPATQEQHNMVSKVLVNPHFSKTVFVNPNYRPTGEHLPVTTSKIHVNPRIQSIKPPETNMRKILVNPKVLRNIPNDLHKNDVKSLEKKSESEQLRKDQVDVAQALSKSIANPPVLKSIAVPSVLKSIAEPSMQKRIRRLSERSKFKIIRSHSKCKGSGQLRKNEVDIENPLPETIADPPVVKRIRRLSVRSKFKIIRSHSRCKETEQLQKDHIDKEHTLPKSVTETPVHKRIRRLSVRSKFKIIRSHSRCKENEKDLLRNPKRKQYSPLKKFQVGNKFKLDNRRNNTLVMAKRAKFVFDNKYLSTSDIAKSIPVKLSKCNKMKSSNLLNISGIMYKNSPNSLRRSAPTVKSRKSVFKIQDKSICKSKYKFIRKTSHSKNVSADEKKTSPKYTRLFKQKRISVEKLRICNIPCQYYQKFGKCKRKDIGKCHRKHDPDQIALCTKFLQGACIDDSCLLSHNVSSEKMPTCKYYLEGSCSKDQCPYIHVRISPKADICKDFLEGFCRKASECDKRHQFLCPDYEKKGCVKPRCPYPHGKMVRKYSVFNKHKFAKKSSNNTEEQPCEKQKKVELTKKREITKLSKTDSARYYLDRKNVSEGESLEQAKSCEISTSDKTICNQEIGFRVRPKLGDLPSFIAFEEK